MLLSKGTTDNNFASFYFFITFNFYHEHVILINGGRNKICIDWKMKIISDKKLKPLIYLLELPPIHLVTIVEGNK